MFRLINFCYFATWSALALLKFDSIFRIVAGDGNSPPRRTVGMQEVQICYPCDSKHVHQLLGASNIYLN